MSFFTKLMEDAKPKAETLSNATKNITHKVIDSRAVQATKSLSYKGLVNTVGIGMVLTAPAVSKGKDLLSSAWKKVEEAAVKPAVVVKK